VCCDWRAVYGEEDYEEEEIRMMGDEESEKMDKIDYQYVL
jgi:hypothetical protein